MEHRDRIHSGSGVRGQSVGDWAASGARNVADVTRQRLDETKETAKDYASAAKEYVQDAIQQTREHETPFSRPGSTSRTRSSRLATR